ncbi:MAG: alpha/beta fold hydrolase [Myxococcaceae bacterium]|nr:alpha/beta fold hydrolase [Myxococcaceae bacterium]
MALRLLLLAVCTSGCLLRASVPMDKVEYAVNPPARCLVVLMPGAGSDMNDFEKEGFVAKVKASGLSLDVVAANAVFGYYIRGAMLPRVHEDIMVPLQTAKKYEKRWIMGMSMGGFGSLFYTMNHPEDVDGAFAMAPFLGDEKLIREIKDAGGLDKWQAPEAQPVDGDNYQRQLWRWLQEVTNDPTKTPAELWVGWGKEDSLAPADQLLGDRLPPERVLLTDGAHEWGPWNTLVERFLKEGPLARDCAAPVQGNTQ